MSDYYCKCKTCANIDPTEKSGYKWYCTEYRSYEDPDIVRECKRYREGNLSSSGCFLTSACCRYKGFPDDCAELTALRSFRDNYLLSTEEGRTLVDKYYRIAPALVAQIDGHPQENTIYTHIFSSIQQIILLVEKEEHKKAVAKYREMVCNVQSMLQD